MSPNKILIGLIVLIIALCAYRGTGGGKNRLLAKGGVAKNTLKEKDKKIVEKFAEYIEKNPEILQAVNSGTEEANNNSLNLGEQPGNQESLSSNEYEIIFENSENSNADQYLDSNNFDETSQQIYEVEISDEDPMLISTNQIGRNEEQSSMYITEFIDERDLEHESEINSDEKNISEYEQVL
jgi:hypothetical protein